MPNSTVEHVSFSDGQINLRLNNGNEVRSFLSPPRGRGVPIGRSGMLIGYGHKSKIGPLQDPVTWYGINYAGTQITQWDFQNKEKSGWTGKISLVWEVPLRYLRPSVIYYRNR